MSVRPLGDLVLLVAVLGATLVAPRAARAGVAWEKLLDSCEPPNVFYSSRHQAGRVPCCASQPGVCPGGTECPPSGVCAGSGVQCVPGTGPTRPNIVLFISDDQGYCHYGSAGECRSAQSGTAIPAPLTPNLDILAANGTVFPIAHNTAAWCYPSLNSILTGRYQHNFDSSHDALAEHFVTVARATRSLGDSPGVPVDPYDATARVGGYCTYLGGKFTASAGRPGFDAGERGSGRRLGRIPCDDPGDGSQPLCGTERDATYDPGNLPVSDVLQFMDAMLYPAPGTSADFRVQPFFMWYAPRIPHQPLDAPFAVQRYLFGTDARGFGGQFDLGALCQGNTCPPMVRAFDESNFGTVREYYSSIWWVDDNVRELRRFLDAASNAHCRQNDGGHFDVDQAHCRGTWARTIAPSLTKNTVFIYMSDNGWQLPDSKHHYTENGYRTRMIVFDPRTLAEVPSWRAGGPPPAKPYESPAVAHSTDVLPTVLGLALGTPGPQACPVSEDGTACDGHDLRPVLRDAPGGPAPAESLRHALCGHQTKRGTSPSRNRYLVTRPGSVGRCVGGPLPSCTTDLGCSGGRVCVLGRCMPANEPSCSNAAGCQPGAACLGGRCRVAPPCLDDGTCGRLMPGQQATCQAKGQGWCRNAPLRACATRDDCPACPTVNGRELACSRVCEPRILKEYLPGGDGGNVQLVDLFADPDESARFGGRNDLLDDMSDLSGPYGRNIREMACCIDAWWPDGARDTSVCGGLTCPTDLSCSQ